MKDQYLSLYTHEKQRNPDKRIILREFKQQDVIAVDRLVEISQGSRETVKTERDWQVVCELVAFYVSRWPNEWMEFRNSLPEIRQTRKNSGYSDSGEIQYIAAIPLRLERLIKVIFPFNQFDKKFSYEFVKRFKAFRVAGVQN